MRRPRYGLRAWAELAFWAWMFGWLIPVRPAKVKTIPPRPARPVDDLGRRFAYHRPNQCAANDHALIRAECLRLARRITVHCPEGREQALALTKLEEAMFWANAAIARNHK